ncbi:aconitate hydratase [Kibdelosporangium aridum]|uniref:Aconitate hydratase n=2 Tax=Kibdelosporangium aridum TaxID=2030 RepID=A0A1W2FCJ7_KIBAR|nr:aconitate hydratase [Kibdelosporangium aridum]
MNYQVTPISSLISPRMPYTIRILLENLLRNDVPREQIDAVLDWGSERSFATAVDIHPSRIFLHDTNGVPLLTDIAAMRDAVEHPDAVNPKIPVELVVDHSVIAEEFGTPTAFERNVEIEYERNAERYRFLRWAQASLDRFAVVPPGKGIMHQVNLEHLARVVMTDGGWAFPDLCLGTDSHTTMVNGIGVLGWGIGGIDAEAAMLGEAVTMLLPPVVGFRLTGALTSGATATDLVLTITELLREHGVVGKFVEFHGEGVRRLSVPDRATIANMSPEFGSTCAYFPIDDETIRYLRFTGRSEEQVALVEAYAKEQGLWHRPEDTADYTETVELDLGTVQPSLAGPNRPQDRIALADAAVGNSGVVGIAAITSCTNTSNPSVMIMAGLLARNAVLRGLTSKPWVKTTLSPGSRVVTDYLDTAGLTPSLEKLGFHLTGYGCMTCIGASGPLVDELQNAVRSKGSAVVAVLSGNRNFAGRINPDIRMNYLASPPLVIAYALTGTMATDLTRDPLGHSPEGTPVFLSDIWPSQDEVTAVMEVITPDMFEEAYRDIFTGDTRWENLGNPGNDRYDWDPQSTYLRRPPFFDEPIGPQDIKCARVLAVLGDSVTTDHISPAGAIPPGSPAGRYLAERGVKRFAFNTYASRRGNHEVMVRGAFGNVQLPGIYEAAMAYRDAGVPLVILGGAQYGTGSSRDWAAKATALLGVRAVLAESFERIHRSNLIGMGVLPLQYRPGENARSLGLTGREVISIRGVSTMDETITVHADEREFDVVVRLDTAREREVYRAGGILRLTMSRYGRSL